MKRRKFFQLLGWGAVGSFWPERKNIISSEASVPKKNSHSMDAWIEIDLAAIAWNLQQIKKRTSTKIMAVVKANAYGHGLVEVSQALEKSGVDWLMVGKLDEASTLRRAGLKGPLLNFGPFDRRDAEQIIKERISQSVYTDEVFFLAEAAAKVGAQASIHLDLDTGMGRTGMAYELALRFLEKVASNRHLRLEGISTTLTEDVEFDREQVRRLNEVFTQAKKRGINCGLRHAASSAGLLASPEFYLDMVRPGITLYGYYPNAPTQKEDPLQLKPALRLKARVIFIKDLKPGDTLSYHRAFKASKKMRVATLSLGYSDGYQPQLGGKSWAIIRGQKCPVLPIITANHLMVDLEGNQEVNAGEEALLIDSVAGSPLSAAALSEASGLSTYRLLIGLNPLLTRYFI